ncbi:MAG: tyrosine/phenylalanine carboxypeptidase domain-containing protein, partial [Polyangiales bacterium]
DAVYLRGLGKVLRYVQAGGDLKPLFAGKLAAEHIPIIKELQYRKVLKPIPIVPRYMKDPTAIERLEQLRQSSASVVALIGKPAAMK